MLTINIFLRKKLSVSVFLVLTLAVVLTTSCKKLVTVPGPINAISSANVYTSDQTAIAVLSGIYTNMAGLNIGTNGSNQIRGLDAMFLYPALSADELTLYDRNSALYYPYYLNTLNNNNVVSVQDFWRIGYPVIYATNAAINGITASGSLSPAVKQQLLGEAYFMRAYTYFYLVNFYGDVPLVLGTDYKTNESAAKSPKAAIWAQIISDLKIAEGDLSANFLDGTLMNPTADRVRPTKWAAATLLAKAYLFTGSAGSANWATAETEATTVINNSTFSLGALNSVFLSTSTEAIWQLQPVGTGNATNTGEGLIFVLPKTGPSATGYPVYLSNDLLSSFEPGDQRKVSWVNGVTVTVGGKPVTYNYAYKYKIGKIVTTGNERSTLFRLAEVYLMRAEARAEQGNISGAQADLNVIRQRAGLGNTQASTQADLLTAIFHERRIELFTEGGNRWLDIKRNGTVDAVMTNAAIAKGSTWKSYQQLYPIPLSELNEDPALVQTPGY